MEGHTAIIKLVDGRLIKTKKDSFTLTPKEFFEIRDYKDTLYIIPYTAILYIQIVK